MVQEGIDIKSIKWTQHWVVLNTWSMKPCCGCEYSFYKAWLGCHTSLDLILPKNTHNFVFQFWRIELVYMSEDDFKVHLYEFQGLQRLSILSLFLKPAFTSVFFLLFYSIFTVALLKSLKILPQKTSYYKHALNVVLCHCCACLSTLYCKMF